MPFIFNQPLRKDIVYNVVRFHREYRHQTTHMQKNQGEVSGTGAKPAPQKGRGMARIGNKRNALTRGGGIQWAIRPRDFSISMNKKTVLKGLMTGLTMKLVEKKIIIVEDENIPPKRLGKQFETFLKKNNALVLHEEASDVAIKRRKTTGDKINLVNPKVKK